MKKFLLVLLVVALASFLFVGCLPTTPPAEGEGEGEAEVTIVIDDAVVVDGKTYVSCGDHTITVTFPAPVVGGVSAYITCCTGDYSKASAVNNDLECGSEVVLFPSADGTVWSGSGEFGCDGFRKIDAFICSPCCASYVEIYAGECVDEVCIKFPVIVDCCPPYALIDIDVDNCICEGCEITFESTETDPDCAEAEECCDDLCSGLAGWSIVLYEDYPFDECCDPSICEEPIGSCSGTECPIDCTTECLDEGTYWVVITLVDNVGLETVYIAEIIVSGGDDPEDTCDIVVVEYAPLDEDPCIEFVDTHDWVGTCYWQDECNLPY